MEPIDVDAVRRDTPGLSVTAVDASEHGPVRVHMNAMQSLQPKATIDAAKRQLDLEAKMHGSFVFEAEALAGVNLAHCEVASLVGCTTREVFFMQGTAWQAVRALVRTMDLGSSDRVICHGITPSGLGRLRCSAEIAPTLSDGSLDVNELAKILAGGSVKLVIIPHIEPFTATVTDVPRVADLVHACGARLLLDATSSVGRLHSDVSKHCVDFWVAAGHGYLRAARGITACVARDDRVIEALRDDPCYCGVDEAYTDAASAFGTLAFVAAFGAACGYLAAVGLQSVRRRIELLELEFRKGLTAEDLRVCPAAKKCKIGTVRFTCDGDTSSLVDLDQRIATAGLTLAMADGMFEAHVHYYNTLEEVRHAVNMIHAVLALPPVSDGSEAGASQEWTFVDADTTSEGASKTAIPDTAETVGISAAASAAAAPDDDLMGHEADVPLLEVDVSMVDSVHNTMTASTIAVDSLILSDYSYSDHDLSCESHADNEESGSELDVWISADSTKGILQSQPEAAADSPGPVEISDAQASSLRECSDLETLDAELCNCAFGVLSMPTTNEEDDSSDCSENWVLEPIDHGVKSMPTSDDEAGHADSIDTFPDVCESNARAGSSASKHADICEVVVGPCTPNDRSALPDSSANEAITSGMPMCSWPSSLCPTTSFSAIQAEADGTGPDAEGTAWAQLEQWSYEHALTGFSDSEGSDISNLEMPPVSVYSFDNPVFGVDVLHRELGASPSVSSFACSFSSDADGDSSASDDDLVRSQTSSPAQSVSSAAVSQPITIRRLRPDNHSRMFTPTSGVLPLGLHGLLDEHSVPPPITPPRHRAYNLTPMAMTPQEDTLSFEDLRSSTPPPVRRGRSITVHDMNAFMDRSSGLLEPQVCRSL
mmetsp:Transcript_9996/g.30206  ORF Transcript_9996/g.30206 Transcript_9996/m.30206 type:complete len:883 (+) Transcript_9996:273-2921(+)